MPWFSRPADRRIFPRFQANIPVLISLVGDTQIASLRTLADGISEGGLSLAPLPGLQVGATVSLELHLPTARDALWLDASVRHNTGHCGLEFSYISPEQRRAIDHYCRLQPYEKVRV
jgi:c-di-GMP-binding flagellar brake protein YcgR